jgi:predicted GTPase/uncharacterized protein (DUF697 family)
MSNHLHEIVDLLLAAIQRLPDPPRENMKRELTLIKELIVDSRAPKIMIVGRRGAGKSSLINAIFDDQVAKVGSVLSQTGKPEWHDFKNAKGSIRILDTRGLGDLTRPESSNFETALEEIKDAVARECPDALLFLCKAKEVDAHIAEDLRTVVQIRDFVKSKHGYSLPMISVTTQVDELDPKRVEPPFENEQKQANISTAVRAIELACKGAGLDTMKVIPVSAYAEYQDGKKTFSSYWNIDVLVEFLMEVLPNSAQLQLARLSSIRGVQIKFARILVGSTATICAGIAAVPIPLADVIPITAAQIGMITGIAYLSGRELSQKTAAEFLTALGVNVGAGFVLREGARALIKFVFPGGGLVVSAGVAAAGTWAIGSAAIAYFIEGKSIEETKAAFDNSKKENGPTKEPE